MGLAEAQPPGASNGDGSHISLCTACRHKPRFLSYLYFVLLYFLLPSVVHAGLQWTSCSHFLNASITGTQNCVSRGTDSEILTEVSVFIYMHREHLHPLLGSIYLLGVSIMTFQE